MTDTIHSWCIVSQSYKWADVSGEDASCCSKSANMLNLAKLTWNRSICFLRAACSFFIFIQSVCIPTPQLGHDEMKLVLESPAVLRKPHASWRAVGYSITTSTRLRHKRQVTTNTMKLMFFLVIPIRLVQRCRGDVILAVWKTEFSHLAPLPG